MGTFTVSTTSALLTCLATARSGDTILLASGTYSGVLIQNLSLAGVTITSADLGNPAVLTDMTIRYCTGLNVNNLEMFVTKDMPFQVQNSSNITLDQLNVHGSLDGTSNDDFRGMMIRDSSNVTVSSSWFHELTDALSHNNAQYFTAIGNRFETIRDNGICGGGSSHVLVSDNVFLNFDHVGGVHPDAIQFWTAYTTTNATDIVVTGNLVNRGTGTAIQGIWIKDDLGNMPYQNVTVTNNVVVGAMYNGIALVGVQNATVSSNTVIGEVDQNSWLGFTNVTGATISDNIASAYSFSNSTYTAAGDVLTSSLSLADAMTDSGLLAASSLPGGNGTVTSQFKAAVLANINLIGFTDGPSPTGQTYNFGVVNVYGTSGVDRLSAGTVGGYHLYGYDGNDSFTGSHNGIPTIMEGGIGDDSYTIYQAADFIVERPGEGNDSVYSAIDYTLPDNVETLRALSGGLTLHGNALANVVVATAGGDTLYGEGGDDTVQGAAGNDTLYGGDGVDRLYGYDGNDLLDGGAGNDVLTGGNGNDIMLGGDGNDTLEGGAGSDILTGGAGSDTFVYRATDANTGNLATSTDTITDFSTAQGDKISLSAIDAKLGTTADDAFTFIGTQAFHNIAGELRYVAEGDGITIYGDNTGAGVATFALHLSGLTSITSSAFTL